MLRWLALTLVLLNAVALFWFSQARQADLRSAARLPPPQGQLLEVLDDQYPINSPAVQPSIRLEPVEIPLVEQTVCVMSGPFATADEARAARRQIDDLAELQAELVWRPTLLRTDYWVHIGPMASRQVALTRLRELHASGIDSFIITEGELTNAISLGYFTREELAQKSLGEWQQRGVEARVRAIPRREQKIWLTISGNDGRAIPVAVLERVQTESSREVEKNFCNEIASLEKFE